MDELIKVEKQEIEKFFSENKEHENKIIDFMLVNREEDDIITITSDGVDEMIEFSKNNGTHNEIPDWDFTFDYYLFERLENGYEIETMSNDIHYSIWNSINELYPEDINNKDGVQRYLQYCANNGITKEFLDKQTNLNTPDIMKYFNGLALFETMEYKGYVLEADDTNLDNGKENLVNIYETKEDYDKKEPIETVSLNTVGLKQNIREYIDEFYIDKTIIEKETAYYTFVIGYDLLQDEFKNSPCPECDLTYGFCEKIAKDFVNSDSYKYDNRSSYELLGEYIKKNRFQILKEYEQFIGVENIYFQDNKKLLEASHRNDQQVALVEWLKGNRKEYVIAINYNIDGDKIFWGAGHYYTDLKDAKVDFERVKNGESLVHREKSKERDER